MNISKIIKNALTKIVVAWIGLSTNLFISVSRLCGKSDEWIARKVVRKIDKASIEYMGRVAAVATISDRLGTYYHIGADKNYLLILLGCKVRGNYYHDSWDECSKLIDEAQTIGDVVDLWADAAGVRTAALTIIPGFDRDHFTEVTKLPISNYLRFSISPEDERSFMAAALERVDKLIEKK